MFHLSLSAVSRLQLSDKELKAEDGGLTELRRQIESQGGQGD